MEKKIKEEDFFSKKEEKYIKKRICSLLNFFIETNVMKGSKLLELEILVGNDWFSEKSLKESIGQLLKNELKLTFFCYLQWNSPVSFKRKTSFREIKIILLLNNFCKKDYAKEIIELFFVKIPEVSFVKEMKTLAKISELEFNNENNYLYIPYKTEHKDLISSLIFSMDALYHNSNTIYTKGNDELFIDNSIADGLKFWQLYFRTKKMYIYGDEHIFQENGYNSFEYSGKTLSDLSLREIVYFLEEEFRLQMAKITDESDLLFEKNNLIKNLPKIFLKDNLIALKFGKFDLNTGKFQLNSSFNALFYLNKNFKEVMALELSEGDKYLLNTIIYNKEIFRSNFELKIGVAPYLDVNMKSDNKIGDNSHKINIAHINLFLIENVRPTQFLGIKISFDEELNTKISKINKILLFSMLFENKTAENIFQLAIIISYYLHQKNDLF